MGMGSENTFHATDYALFGVSLAASVAVGVFYLIKDRKKANTRSLLLGDRKMSPIPVSLSLMATFQSAIGIIGTPAEIHFNGTMFSYIVLASIPTTVMCNYCFIPVFYNLKVTSVYEYLSLRFSMSLRTLVSVIFTVQMMLYLAVALYAPALSLSAVTGFPLWPTVVVVGVVCIFYTTLGGMKAVLWTDTIQMVVIIAGMLAVLIQGTIETGGLSNAWDIARDHGRIIFNDFSLDPTVRHSFWCLVIGGTFSLLALFATNQAQVQRACCCPSLTQARVAYWINLVGFVYSNLVYIIVGIVMFAYYIECDPYTHKRIDSRDQTLPIFVMDLLGRYSGMPGLFVACLFSGSLSTLSSGLNAMAAAMLQDVIRPFIAPNMSETVATWVTRFLAVGFGVVCLALTYVASFFGGILQTVIALFGVISGPVLGVFVLGIFCPWTNSLGAFVGLIVSLAVNLLLLTGATLSIPRTGFTRFDGCDRNVTVPGNFNGTNLTTTSVGPVSEERSSMLTVYKLSYQYYALLAVLINILLGTVVSLVSGFFTGFSTASTVGANLLCPFYSQLFPDLFKGRKPQKYDVDKRTMGMEDHPLTSDVNVTCSANSKT